MKKFYFCSTCGNIFGVIDDSGPIPMCCGEDMVELIPKIDDTLIDKHLPIIICDKTDDPKCDDKHPDKDCDDKHLDADCDDKKDDPTCDDKHDSADCDEKHNNPDRDHKQHSCRPVCVQVGEVKHPMTEMHHIKWIILETDKGTYRKCVKAYEEPIVNFYIACDECIRAVYSFCNLHGLWKKEIKEDC